MRFSHLLATAALVLAAPVAASAADWTKVADALGKSGTEMPGGVYRVGLPRTDLKVTLDGVEIKPALALGSWLAFAEHGRGEVMVMGDLVLTATSPGSRNFRYGLALGRGEAFDPGVVVEGRATARAAAALGARGDLDLPVTRAVAALVEGRTDVETAMRALLDRPLKEE